LGTTTYGGHLTPAGGGGLSRWGKIKSTIILGQKANYFVFQHLSFAILCFDVLPFDILNFDKKTYARRKIGTITVKMFAVLTQFQTDEKIWNETEIRQTENVSGVMYIEREERSLER
jgi:hypothetical protein